MTSKVATIPFAVLARDKTIAKHVDQAIERTDNLINASDYLRGWHEFIIKLMLDHYTQDNGCFAQVVGGGLADKEVIGWPFGLLHMDAARMQRTSNPEYPCIYTDRKSQRYKVHYTRLIEMSSMPSPNLEMNGVGMCAISRCVSVAQNLIDISVYEQEKMGSRPARQMLVGSKVSTADIKKAFAEAELQMSQRGLTRYAQKVAIGNPNQDIGIDVKDLNTAPDGFSKDESTKLAVAAIALAFGVDFREFWPATVTGATKSDAELSHQKAKGKWAEVLQRIERVMNQKFLPPHLMFKFDWHDEEDNQLHAQVEYTRAQAAEKSINTGITVQRVVREKWLEEGVIDEAKFEYMELQDGRLVDGTDVLYLFKSDSEDMKVLLKLPMENPTDIEANSADAAIKAIDAQLDKVIAANVNTSRDNIKRVTRQAIAALNKLKASYTEKAETEKQEKLQLEAQNDAIDRGGQAPATKPKPVPSGSATSPETNRGADQARPGRDRVNVGS